MSTLIDRQAARIAVLEAKLAAKEAALETMSASSPALPKATCSRGDTPAEMARTLPAAAIVPSAAPVVADVSDRTPQRSAGNDKLGEIDETTPVEISAPVRTPPLAPITPPLAPESPRVASATSVTPPKARQRVSRQSLGTPGSAAGLGDEDLAAAARLTAMVADLEMDKRGMERELGKVARELESAREAIESLESTKSRLLKQVDGLKIALTGGGGKAKLEKLERQMQALQTQEFELDEKGKRNNDYRDRESPPRRGRHGEPLPEPRSKERPVTAFEKLIEARYQTALFQQAKYGKINLSKVEASIVHRLPSGSVLESAPQRPATTAVSDMARPKTMHVRMAAAPPGAEIQVVNSDLDWDMMARPSDDALNAALNAIPGRPSTPTDGGFAEAVMRVRARALLIKKARAWVARTRVRMEREKREKEGRYVSPSWALTKPDDGSPPPPMGSVKSLDGQQALTAPVIPSLGTQLGKLRAHAAEQPGVAPGSHNFSSSQLMHGPPRRKSSPRGMASSASLPALQKRPPPSPRGSASGSRGFSRGQLSLSTAVLEEPTPPSASYLKHMANRPLPPPGPPAPPPPPPPDAPFLQTPSSLSRGTRRNRTASGESLPRQSLSPVETGSPPVPNSSPRRSPSPLRMSPDTSGNGSPLQQHAAADFAVPKPSVSERAEKDLSGLEIGQRRR